MNKVKRVLARLTEYVDFPMTTEKLIEFLVKLEEDHPGTHTSIEKLSKWEEDGDYRVLESYYEET